MTDSEIFSGAHAVVRDARNACRDPEKRDHLEQLRAALWERTLVAQRDEALPLVFDTLMCGYITLGVSGETQTYPHPGHPGLDDAATIFSHGLTVCNTLHASDLVGLVKRPGNTLRNRLAKAAEWMDRVAVCHELSRAVRTISISDDGRIGVGRHLNIELTDF